jgi:hypothetical protein
MKGACEVCGASDWGTRNRCNVCRAAAQRLARSSSIEARAKDAARYRAWRAANPGQSRAQTLRKRYGLDLGALETLLAAQNGRCAICRASEATCIDHCHETGRVRGVLCRMCNSGLGQFRDDPERIRCAIRYLAERTP